MSGANRRCRHHRKNARRFCFLLGRPAVEEGIKALIARGFHKPGDVENRPGHYLGQIALYAGNLTGDRSTAQLVARRELDHREVSLRRRRSLSFMISLKSTTGRISTGPSPYLKPGCCETS
jgi:hypothetical protein